MAEVVKDTVSFTSLVTRGSRRLQHRQLTDYEHQRGRQRSERQLHAGRGHKDLIDTDGGRLRMRSVKRREEQDAMVL